MRLRLPLHGRSHLPQGADPIPGGFLHFGENTDSYGAVFTVGDGFPWVFDTDGNGFDTLTGGGAYSVDTGGGGYSVDTNGGGFTVDAAAATINSSSGISLDSQADVLIDADTDFSVEATDDVAIRSHSSSMGLDMFDAAVSFYSGSVPMDISVGNESLTITINGNAMLRLDPDGTLHIKSGATWVADL